VTTLATHGTLKLSGTAVALNGTFTQTMSTPAGHYSHDNSNNNDSFNFSVADSPGSAATGTFGIATNEAAATIDTNTGLSVGEGTTASLSSSQLSASGDNSDPPSELVYTVTNAPTHGTLKLSGTAVALNAPSPRTTSTPARSPSPRMAATTTTTSPSRWPTPRRRATGTFSISFNGGSGHVGTNTGLSLGEGTTASVSSSQLSASADASDPASELVYTVTTLATHGTLKLSGTAVALNGTFTQADINTGKVTFTQDGSDNNDNFAFSVADSPGAATTGTLPLPSPRRLLPSAPMRAESGRGHQRQHHQQQLSASADASDPPVSWSTR